VAVELSLVGSRSRDMEVTQLLCWLALQTSLNVNLTNSGVNTEATEGVLSLKTDRYTQPPTELWHKRNLTPCAYPVRPQIWVTLA
jgi:hypothetical protein